MSMSNPMITEQLAAEVAEKAILFYQGDVSSADAFEDIDRVAKVVWHYYPGVINDAHALFDEVVGLLIDTDVDEWANPEPATTACIRYGHHRNLRTGRCNRCLTVV